MDTDTCTPSCREGLRVDDKATHERGGIPPIYTFVVSSEKGCESKNPRMSICLVPWGGVFPSLMHLSGGLGETVVCVEHFPAPGSTDHPRFLALFIALLQPKSEGAEAKDRRQDLDASEWKDNSEVF